MTQDISSGAVKPSSTNSVYINLGAFDAKVSGAFSFMCL